MNLSLFSRMKELQQMGVLTLEAEPGRHYFPGEGRWKFRGKDLEFLTDYTGESPDGSKSGWKTPHDLAWSPSEKEVVAYAPSIYERFIPREKRHEKRT